MSVFTLHTENDVFSKVSAFKTFSKVAFSVSVLGRSVDDGRKPVHPSTLNDAFSNTLRFQKSPLLKPFSKVAVFISVFGRCTVDDERKRIKKFASSNEKEFSYKIVDRAYF